MERHRSRPFCACIEEGADPVDLVLDVDRPPAVRRNGRGALTVATVARYAEGSRAKTWRDTEVSDMADLGMYTGKMRGEAACE